jgi:hypothetical protein
VSERVIVKTSKARGDYTREQRYTGCFKKSFTTLQISNAGALAVAVLGTTVPRA